MTIHTKMWDEKERRKEYGTQHRIVVEFTGGHRLTTLDPKFHTNFQEMIVEYGAPTSVTYEQCRGTK